MEPIDLSDPFSLPDPYAIEPIGRPLDAVVEVPGSKSITNRALICAALATGTSHLHGALMADDTEAMIGVLRALGVEITHDGATDTLTVVGNGGEFETSEHLDVRQSGTTARFLLPMLALGRGSFRVTADSQMQARPMDATFAALRELGTAVEDLAVPGRLPATLHAGPGTSGVIRVPGDGSSQFLSGLLLSAPGRPDGLVIEVTTELVSRPYVDMTIAVMTAFGAQVEQPDPQTFAVMPGRYQPRSYTVEPDASAASYPLAAAAICGGRVRVRGLRADSIQGDVAFADVLAAMGATVVRDEHGTEVTGPGRPLDGGSFDLAHFSDTAQTLAVVAPFASAAVTVSGIGFIRAKETDRITAVATELRRLGVDVSIDPDGWTIHPGRPTPTTVQTYRDHRMAMSFALAGLSVGGISIADPACVAKTFPGFWAMLEGLRPPSR